MSEQSLANQLGWSITTLDYLEDLVYRINSVSNSYEALVGGLSASNYVKEMLEPLEMMSREFCEKTDDLVAHVRSDHVDYIERQKEAILMQMRDL